MDYSPFMPMTNCSVLDVETLLRDTVKIGNATIKQPKSIQVAVAKLIQIIANVASSQYGGISLPDLDILLEPYAKMNYEKHLLDVERYNIPNGENYARNKTIKDIYDSMQSLEYEVNTISASTGQSPFVTVSFGFSKSWIGREIQKSILNVRMNKLGDGKIAIFPKLVFFHQKGLNYYETDPNYDIKKLAIKCASECMYPDVISVDREMEILGHRVTPMGK
ncbi:anaerobic ribonucleoside-triphosphate reductase [Sutterella wadsworthensis]|uniref:anaerobic ribonucleoside-triphosphate reductase n=1 Tax=Sutterella wadsworthensis TaxID=40545 RepID=UPI0032BFB80D